MSLYILESTDNNFTIFAIYHTIAVFFIALTFVISRQLSNNYKAKLIGYRLSTILNFAFFALLIILKQDLAKYIYLLAIFDGASQGLYYASFNMIESRLIKEKQSAAFYGLAMSASSVIKIVFPILFGLMIKVSGDISVISIFLIMSVIELFLSYKISLDQTENIHSKTSLLSAMLHPKYSNLAKVFFFSQLVKQSLFLFLTFSVIISLKNSLNLGIFESIFGIIAALAGLVMYKYKSEYNRIVYFAMFLILSASILLLFGLKSWLSILLYKFCTITIWQVISMFDQSSGLKISNQLQKDEINKDDFYTAREIFLNSGRMAGYLLAIVLVTSTNLFIRTVSLIILLIANGLVFYYIKKTNQQINQLI